MGSFYETPKEDAEKEELKQQIAELSAQLEQKSSAFIEVNDQMAMLEKSYELAAKYINNGQQPGQPGVIHRLRIPHLSPITQKPQAAPVQALRENTVSGLQQPMSNVEFM